MAKSNTVPHKSCIRCGKVLPLDAFPKNREWVTMSYRDAWCTECGKKYVVDRETVEQYCHDNNRQWKDAYWEACIKKAQYAVATDEDYLKEQVQTALKGSIILSKEETVRGLIDWIVKAGCTGMNEHYRKIVFSATAHLLG